MAELTQEEAEALGVALAPHLAAELDQDVRLLNVADEGRRWDLEARSMDDQQLLRRISCFRLVHEPSMKARAELRDDFRPALEAGLAARGVRGYWISYNTQELPRSKASRREYGDFVAVHVARCLASAEAQKQLVTAGCIDLRTVLWRLDGRDAVWFHRGFNSFRVIRAPDDRLAQVVGQSDRRFARFVPALSDAVLPAIRWKLDRHGSVAAHLTILVQIQDLAYGRSEAQGVASALREHPEICRSVYLAWHKRPAWGTQVVRVQ